MDYIVHWMIISFIPLIALYSVNTQKLFVLNELIIKSMYLNYVSMKKSRHLNFQGELYP